MSSVNNTKFKPGVFLLTGIPGHEDVPFWISVPFCLMYVTSIMANSVILFIIKTEETLHEPMYIFLSMLAVTDLGISISTMPTTLRTFWFNSREITHDACFTQIFFISSLSFVESSVLLSMAFDRFVAICNPLRYASILTPPRIAKMGLVSLLRTVLLIIPLPIILKQYQYCEANVLFHPYCLNQEVIKLACSDITVSIISGILVTLFSVGLDLLFILLSYVMILKTVLSIVSRTERLKALNTCVCHICVVLLFYVPSISLTVIYRFVKMSSPLVHVVMGNIYLLVPPVMNPIVYSMKTKPIRDRIIRVFNKRNSATANESNY